MSTTVKLKMRATLPNGQTVTRTTTRNYNWVVCGQWGARWYAIAWRKKLKAASNLCRTFERLPRPHKPRAMHIAPTKIEVVL